MVNSPTALLSIAIPSGFEPRVLALEGEEGLSTPFRFEVTARIHEALDYPRLLGTEMAVALRTGDGAERWFSGIVNRIEEGEQGTEGLSCRISLAPRFALLARRVQSRIFQQQTVPQILATILANTRVSFRLTQSYEPRNYCTQYRESDFAFASRLMEEEGIRYSFRHRRDGHEMIVTDDPAPAKADTRLRFRRNASNRDVEPRSAWQWQKFQELTSSGFTIGDHHFELFGQPLEGGHGVPETVSVGAVRHTLRNGFNHDLRVTEGCGQYARDFDGIGPDGRERPDDLSKVFARAKHVARLRAQAEATQAFDISGQSNACELAPGVQFELTGHANADGAYYPTRILHRATQPEAHSGAGVPFDYHNEFSVLPASLPYRPLRRTARPVIAGTQPATVVGPAGETVFIDPFGRVKVQFSWDRQGKKDGNASCWVRVSQRWAGKRYGAFFWPRIGHEVVVAFEEGDPDRPLIVGSVYNAENMPPFDLPGNELVAGIKSASAGADPTTDYNAVLFYDQKDAEHVQIHSQRDDTLNSEKGKHVRSGTELVQVVGALPSLGSEPPSSGSKDWRSHLQASGSQVFAGWGKNLDFVFGDTVTSVLGMAGKNVVGANADIFVNPLSFAGQMPGPGLILGPALGKTEITLGARSWLMYGPQIFVQRGERIMEIGKPITPVSFIGANLAAGFAVAANVYFALNTNENDPAAYGTAAALFKGAVVGMLVGLESTLVRADAAKRDGELAAWELEDLRKTLTQDMEAARRQLSLAKSMSKSMERRTKEAARTAQRALEQAQKALAYSSTLETAPQANFIDLNLDRYNLFSEGSVSFCAGASANLNAFSSNPKRPGFITGSSAKNVILRAGDVNAPSAVVKLVPAGSIDIYAGNNTILANSAGGNCYWKLGPSGFRMGLGPSGQELSLVALNQDCIFLRYLGQAGHEVAMDAPNLETLPPPTPDIPAATIEITNEGIRLSCFGNSIWISRQGIRLKASKIMIKANVSYSESSMQHVEQGSSKKMEMPLFMEGILSKSAKKQMEATKPDEWDLRELRKQANRMKDQV
jgi:type VI secretion system secreted protein VgrG